jgi:hypothetical protein
MRKSRSIIRKVTDTTGVGVIVLVFFYFVFDNSLVREIVPVFKRSGIQNELSSEGIEEERGGRKKFELLRHQSPGLERVPYYIRPAETAWMENITKVQSPIGRKGKMTDRTQWQNIGPYNLGGRTRALALDISDLSERTILAGCVTGGMWRSEDLGSTWHKTSGASQSPSVNCLVQDTRKGHEQKWYFGTGEVFDASAPDDDNGLIRGNGIYKSLNGGRSWKLLASTSTGDDHLYDNPFDYVWDLAIDTSNPEQDELYAATINGIFRSVNGGESWEQVLWSSGKSGRFTDLAITSDGVVYATISDTQDNLISGGIFRSTDGLHWEKINPVWWPVKFNRVVLAVCPGNENKLFVLADLSTEAKKKHLLCVFEEGKGWKDLSANLPDYPYGLGDYDSQLSFTMTLAVKPDDENVVFLGGVNLYRSTDGFRTLGNIQWIGGYEPRKTDRSKYPQHHPDQHALVFFRDNKKMLSGHDGGISMLQDNLADVADWKSLNNGYVTSQFYSVAINQASTDEVLVGGMQDNGTYSGRVEAETRSWTSILAGDGSHCAISNNGDHYYVSSQYGRIYRLDHRQGNYSGFARIDPAASLNYLFINPFVLDPYNSNILYMAGGECIWRNDNAAGIPSGSDEPVMHHWRKLEGTCTGGNISALAVSSVPENIVYYGTSKGRLFRMNDANTGDPKITEITGSNFPDYFGRPVGYISSLSVDPFDAQRIMVTFSNYEIESVYFSADGGIRWESIGGNLEVNSQESKTGPAVYSGSMLHRSKSILYFLGTSTGLFYTDSLQGTKTIWHWIQEVGNIPVEMVVSRQTDGTVVAATHGNGIYKITYDDAITPELRPLTFSMDQNYPNPVIQGNTTVIPLRVDEDMPAEMKLFDASGKLVTILIKDQIKTGEHAIEVSTEGLSPGIYYYSFTSSLRGRKVKKLIVK